MKKSKLQHLKDQIRKLAAESQTFVDVLERIYNKTRGQHNTAALLTAARQHNALIICHTHKWAEELSQREGINATVYSDPKIWTYQGPVLFDMPAMYEFVKAHSRMQHAASDLVAFLDQKGID